MLSSLVLRILQCLGLLLLFKLLPRLLNLLTFCFFVKKQQQFPSSFEQKIIGRQNEELVVSAISNDKQTNQAMLCLQESFSEDPLWNYFLKDFSFKDSIMQKDFKIFLRNKVSGKIILLNKDSQILSTAICYDSQNYKYYQNPYDALSQNLLYIYYFLKELGLKKGINSLLELNKQANFVVTNFEERKKTIMKSYEQEGYFYIYAIGTLVSYRGKGYGEIIMKWILNLADQQKKCVYLESSNPLNLNFYRRLGFEVKDQLRLPTQEYELMSFLIRKPQLKQE